MGSMSELPLLFPEEKGAGGMSCRVSGGLKCFQKADWTLTIRDTPL